MKTIGIKDFKNQVTQLLRQVREEKSEVIVTHDGEPIAVLRPFQEDDDSKSRSEQLKAAMVRADLLAEKISKIWPKSVSAVDAVAEQRR